MSKRSKKKNKNKNKSNGVKINVKPQPVKLKHENKIKIEQDRIQKFVKVSDDWYPNYPGDLVRLFLVNTKGSHRRQFDVVKFVVRGDDDFGMEMSFAGTQEENDAKFIEWKEDIYDVTPEICNVKYFRDLGFKFN